MGHRTSALLIGVRCSVVGKQREISIGARINANFLDRLLLVCAFHRRSQRNDGAGADKERNGVDGRGNLDRLPSMRTFVGPVVVPVGPGWQINLAARRGLLRDRCNQESRPEHVFVP